VCAIARFLLIFVACVALERVRSQVDSYSGPFFFSFFLNLGFLTAEASMFKFREKIASNFFFWSWQSISLPNEGFDGIRLMCMIDDVPVSAFVLCCTSFPVEVFVVPV
jgi:hypothetical protein